jgi:hypothetical protein
MNWKKIAKGIVLGYILSLSLLACPVRAIATSKVGNGGDVVVRFLEDTKAALRVTTESLLISLEEKDLQICNKVTRLNANEKNHCNITLNHLLSSYRNHFYRKPANELKLSINELYITKECLDLLTEQREGEN